MQTTETLKLCLLAECSPSLPATCSFLSRLLNVHSKVDNAVFFQFGCLWVVFLFLFFPVCFIALSLNQKGISSITAQISKYQAAFTKKSHLLFFFSCSQKYIQLIHLCFTDGFRRSRFRNCFAPGCRTSECQGKDDRGHLATHTEVFPPPPLCHWRLETFR